MGIWSVGWEFAVKQLHTQHAPLQRGQTSDTHPLNTHTHGWPQTN